MPKLPLASLILRHHNMTFGILKRSLNPETLRQHTRQFYNARLSLSVAQAVFDSAWRFELSANNQMSTVLRRDALAPLPYSSMQHFDSQLSHRGAPEGLSAPGGRGLLLHPLSHLDCLRIAVMTHARWTEALWRQIRSRIGQIDVSIRVDVRHKGFSLRLQRLQKFRRIPEFAVHANPLEAHAESSSIPDDLLCQLKLRALNLLRSGHIRPFAAARVISPFLRQVQPRISQSNSVPPAQRAHRPSAPRDG